VVANSRRDRHVHTFSSLTYARTGRAYNDPAATTFGDRSDPDFTWFEDIRRGILFALILQDEASLQKLLEFIDIDLAYDEGTFDLPRQDNYFYMLLSFWVRDVEPEKQAMLKKRIKAGRAKHMIKGLEAIEKGDREALKTAMLAVAKHHWEKEFSPRHPVLAVMIEGSILWNIARRAGVELMDLPENVMDRIVRRETLGIDPVHGA